MQNRIRRELHDMETGVVILIGTGRSGKTMTALDWLTAPDVWGDRQKSAFRYPARYADWLGIRSIDEWDSRDPGEVTWVDDAALNFLAGPRDAFLKKWLQAMTIQSHNEQIVLATIQNLMLFDKGIFEAQGVMLMQKYSDWVNILFDREETNERMTIGNLMLDRLRSVLPPEQDIRSYTYSHKHGMFTCSELPGWLDDARADGLDFSKPYRGHKVGC